MEKCFLLTKFYRLPAQNKKGKKNDNYKPWLKKVEGFHRLTLSWDDYRRDLLQMSSNKFNM